MHNWSKSNNNKTSASPLSRRLQAYALAAGAVIAAAPATQAGVITTVVNHTQTRKDTGSATHLYDLDLNGSLDLVLYASDDASGTGEYAVFALSGRVTSDALDFMLPLSGAVIPALSDFKGSNVGVLRSTKGGKIGGNWANNLTQPQYFGVLFPAQNYLRAGWVQVALANSPTDGTSVKLVSYGYESTLITPEPSSIALMAAGVAGLAALRRRRAAK